MKHPVLRIRKGSEQYDDRADELVEERAHEERDERKAEQQEKLGKRRGGLSFLRMRRGSLLPLLIVGIIAFVILRFLSGSSSRATIDGWHAALQAQVLADTLGVGVSFSRVGPADGHAAASVLFVLPDTGEQITAETTLSPPRGAVRRFMHYTPAVKALRAFVSVGGQTRTLMMTVGP